ncbi:GTPase HflX [Mechercharimyces sp. CAU 1602]|uniref:GTPase HflX n=1 Tax=Mechercharimyces sp. CAU 1602 TaxID=2973933 RepID=UPI0021619306|nr:GTPase HflX [Mechercharimyces sp. CAU 1602]MCS1351204.1 GTPase HflX [Mechercharimyces sp. CAU 1602]
MAIEIAIVVGTSTRAQQAELESALEELTRLADTAQAEVVHQVVQIREKPDRVTLVGKGKVAEIVEAVEEHEADVVIFLQELSPAQLRNLEQAIPCKIVDRTQLILDIFAMRAQTHEGRIQVELAQMQYMLPRLVGSRQGLSRTGGGIGTRGPGEKKLEVDRRHIRRRISELKEQLEKVKRHRLLHRSRRRKMDILQVALVGYTNAGKSSLLNQLTNADVLAENQLFATLDPTSRFFELPSKETIMLTDTVGFIRDLPHDLIAAFRSTLEQVTEADLLLHVVDQSHAEADAQMKVVTQVLEELGASHVPVLTVLNKADQTHSEVLTPEGESISVSAFSSMDLLRLAERIDEILHQQQVKGLAKLPVERGEWISSLYQQADIIESEVTGLTMEISFTLPAEQFERLSPEMKSHIQLQ